MLHMSSLFENLYDVFFFFSNYLTNPKLRKDLKVLGISQRGYAYHSWELCKKIKISKLLEHPQSVDDIIRIKKIKNRDMLESLLDFLVGQRILNFRKNKYKFSGKAPKYMRSDDAFIKKNCPGSWEWSHYLYKHAEETLIEGHPHFKTGFFDTNALELWDYVLEESLHSLRLIAIKKLISNIKRDMKIADLGCGSGIALVEILANSKEEIKLVGFDNSEEMIRRSKERIEKFKEEYPTPLNKRNVDTVELVYHNLTEKFPKDEKFDIVFLSLVISYIPKEKRDEFFKNINNILKKEGKVIIFQLLNQSKFNRVFSEWLLYVVPGFCGFPFKDEYLRMLKGNFRDIKSYFRSNIIVANKK